MIGRTARHYLRVLAGLDQPQTQTTQAERDLLVSFLPGARSIVEIGVFEGLTTRLLAEHADPEAVVYGIDPFFCGRLGISWGRMITKHHNRRYLASGKVQLIAKMSTDVDDAIVTPVDFIFIDGDHSLKSITADWAYWRSRIFSNGIIALHDTQLTPEKPPGYTLGSIEYFREHIRYDPDFEIVQQKDSLSVMRKR